ncbi:reductase [Salmonella enterica subsp. enterica]|nr:reductase [Salmonella enterica subsp. enterica]
MRKPSFLITNPGSQQGPRFAGSPLGHEFTSLVWRCCGPAVIRQKKRSRCWSRFAILTAILNSKLIIHSPVITAPDVVQALNLMAVLNPRIKHTAIDGGTFQNEITERNVMGVPGGIC